MRKKINIIGANHFFNVYRPFEEPYNDPKEHFLLKQTPKRLGIWGNYDFYVDSFDLDFDGYVFLDVPEGKRILPNKPAICLIAEAYHENMPLKDGYPQNTIFYTKEFTDQFDKIITTNHPIKHDNIIKTQIGFPWFTTSHKKGIDFDYLNKNDIKKKKKKICMICSGFNDALHNPRLVFAKQIKEIMGDEVDFFGRGIQNFDNVYDLLSNYEYCITFENNRLPNYFTEKLADVFLCNTYPIYNGCTNIYDFFSKDSMMAFDLNDAKKVVAKIRKIIKDDLYNKNYDKILEAKKQVLNKYNLFSLLSENIDLTIKKDNSCKIFFGRNTKKLSKRHLLKNKIISFLPKRIRDSVLKKTLIRKQQRLKSGALTYNREMKLHDRCK